MVIAILLLGLIVRIVGLNQSLWLDEAAQAIESARPLGKQLDIAGDFWPPLYHILLHFWMFMGRSEIWLRLLSVGTGVATIYVTYIMAKKVAGNKVGLLTAFLFSIAPFHVWYSQEVRPYALSALLGVLLTYFLVNHSIYRYIAIGILFLYTSYLAPFLFLAHAVYLYFFEKKLFKKGLISLFMIGIAFIPWLPSFWKQLTIGRGLTQTLPGWSEAVSTPLFKALPLVFFKFILGRISFDNKYLYFTIGLVLFCLVAYLVTQVFKKEKKRATSLLLIIGIPILVVFIVSFWLPILAPQRVIFTLPFFYLLISLGIVMQKRFQLTLITIFVLVSSYSLFLYWTNPRFQREQWRQSVDFVERNRTSASLVLFAFPDAFAPWQWYNQGIVPSVAVAPTLTLKAKDLEKVAPTINLANRLFVYHYLTDLTDPAKQIPQFLYSQGFIEIQKKDFPGVGFVSIYEKALVYR